MPPIAWLLVAAALAVAAGAVGWPAWTASRARDARDTNTERYLAWRGRASREPHARGGLTRDERRRLTLAAGLAILAAAALVAFFVVS
jgi:hypothetical protein